MEVGTKVREALFVLSVRYQYLYPENSRVYCDEVSECEGSVQIEVSFLRAVVL